jgi:hypothetical protein
VKLLKSELSDLLRASFAQRGFSLQPPEKKNLSNRLLPFRRITAGGSCTVSAHMLGRNRFGAGLRVAVWVRPELRVDSLSALLGDQVHLAISPGCIDPGNLGRQAYFTVSEGEDPAPYIRAMFEAIDTIVLPRFEKYSVLENVVECLARLDEQGSRELCACGFPSAWSVLAAAGGAYLLGNIELCDDIARRADALWRSSPDSPAARELIDRKHDFYERYLRARGVNPDAWLLSPEEEAARRARRRPQPRPRALPSPSIWVDGIAGALVPARFEYGYQLLLIGSDNREFVQSLTDVAHKLTTGRYNLMMVAATRPDEKPPSEPRPVSFRNLVIDGQWAIDWKAQSSPVPTPQPATTLQSPERDPQRQLPPVYPPKDPNPDKIAITRKDKPGWSPFYYRQGYAMYPRHTAKPADQASTRELVPTLNEVVTRLRSGEYKLMMSHDRTGKLDIFSADSILIDGAPCHPMQ